MKKAIMTAVMALVATIATAACCSWDVDIVYAMGSTDNAMDYLVYFVDADAFSAASAVTAIESGDATFLNNTAQAWEADDLVDDGYVAGLTGDIYSNGSTANGYLVIFNSDKIDSATHAYVSGIGSDAISPLGGMGTIAFDDTQLGGMQNAANWTAIGAPEPTSGLLLLLGMAGLALKRKRA